MSAASTTTSVRPRRPASLSAAWTAPAASIDGIGRRSNAKPRSLRTRSSVRPRAAATASAREPVEGRGEAGAAIGRRPRRVEPRGRGPPKPAAGAPGGRRGTAGRGGSSASRARRPAEQRRPSPELDAEVHDGPLALRVDRRVRDLGERLAEVVGDRPVDPAETRDRRVVAHAPERLVALEGHRLDVEPGVLGVEAGEEPEVGAGRRAVEDDRRVVVAGHRIDVGDPRRVVDRQAAEELGLRLDVLEDEPASRIDEEQLARPEPAAADGLLGRAAGSRRPRTRRRRAGRASPRRRSAAARSDRRSRRRAGRRRTRSPPGRPTARGSRRSAGGAPRPGDAAPGAAPSASGIAVSSAVPRSQPVATSSSRSSSSDCESEPSVGEQRPGRRELRPPRAPRRIAPPGHGPARGCRGPC